MAKGLKKVWIPELSRVYSFGKRTILYGMFMGSS
jgi:hypothetical protein